MDVFKIRDMRVSRNQERENRIEMNALVDTYSSEEALCGWYSYLEEDLEFPFGIISKGEKGIVTGLAGIEEFDGDFYVYAKMRADSLAIGLSEVELFEASSQTEQAVKDWQYFVEIGDSHSLLGEDECE